METPKYRNFGRSDISGVNESRIAQLSSYGWLRLTDTTLALHYLEYGLAHGRLDIWDSGSLPRLEVLQATSECVVNLRRKIGQEEFLYRFRVSPIPQQSLRVSYARIKLPSSLVSEQDEAFYIAVLDSDVDAAYTRLPNVQVVRGEEHLLNVFKQFPDDSELNNYLAFEAGRFINDAAHMLISWHDAESVFPALAAEHSMGSFGTYLGPGHDSNIRYIFLSDDRHIYEVSLAEDAVSEFGEAWEKGFDSELIIPYQCYPRNSFQTVTATLYTAQREDDRVEIWEDSREVTVCDNGIVQIWSGETLPHESFLGPVFPSEDSLDKSLSTIFAFLKHNQMDNCKC